MPRSGDHLRSLGSVRQCGPLPQNRMVHLVRNDEDTVHRGSDHKAQTNAKSASLMANTLEKLTCIW